jgi:riboflavin synthase
MFTGIISDVGEVIEMTPLGERYRLTVASTYEAATIPLGASIANSGVCLTVVGVAPRGGGSAIAFDVGAETLAVTTLGQWRAGGRVNLERALRVGDELGGHMVSGHVDGIAEIISRRDFDGMAHFRFRAPKDLAKFIAVKGSVALDGASLTVNAVDGDAFEALLIPHTLKVTTWGERRAGDRVNIEVDHMARYAARLIEAMRG